jgi:hypothetical protein
MRLEPHIGIVEARKRGGFRARLDSPIHVPGQRHRSLQVGFTEDGLRCKMTRTLLPSIGTTPFCSCNPRDLGLPAVEQRQRKALSHSRTLQPTSQSWLRVTRSHTNAAQYSRGSLERLNNGLDPILAHHGGCISFKTPAGCLDGGLSYLVDYARPSAKKINAGTRQ